jgi:hypothetical protein
MIPFFRKIRKKMADDNRPLKYMRYAIGEIVLVVIGILIALAINNWNEEKNKHQVEIISLKEVINNLQMDANDLNYNLATDSLTLKSLQSVLLCISTAIPYNDTLAADFGRISYFTNFMNNKSAYENLKSEGFNIINNDSLRFLIVEYYDHTSKVLVNVENEFINKNENLFIKPFMIRNFDYASMFKPAYPNDYEALLKNPEFKSIVSTKIEHYKWKMQLSKDCKKKAIEIIAALNKELDLH